MNCPECHSPSKVLDSRNKPEYLYRRRECLECGERFTTHETLIITRKGVRKELSVQEELDKLIADQARDDRTVHIKYAPEFLDYGNIREGYGG